MWWRNYVAPAVYSLREVSDTKKFILLDTDCHHRDGDREMFKNDPNLLHVCFCDASYVSETNVCVNAGWRSSNEDYLDLVRKELILRAQGFNPAMIFHFPRHDTCQGDYGDIGPTEGFSIDLVKEIKRCADEVCQGRYLIITGGGSRRDVAEYIFPKIAGVLAT